MALITSCWFIIESILIPDGFRKWFLLSFYIHPLFLFLCQILLWIKLLQRWLLVIVCLCIRVTCFLASTIFRVLSSIMVLFSSIRFANDTEFANEVEVEEHEFPRVIIRNQIADSYSSWNSVSTQHKAKVLELRMREYEVETDDNDGSILLEATGEDPIASIRVEATIEDPIVSILAEATIEDEDPIVHTDEATSLEEYMSSDFSSNSPSQDEETNVPLPSLCSSNSPIVERELIDQTVEADLDPFYHKYTERMRWFDLLNHDRTCGISAILNKQLASPCSIDSIKPVEFSIPNISWSKMSRKRLLRSLESDFELVYVAQSCLSWEALHHQYQKVEAIACSDSQTGAFYDNVAGRFQKFLILLERFLEDDRCEGKRYWNYVQRRFSLRSLLQVPQVSGYMEKGEHDETEGEAMRATEVLKGIEKCIKEFWLYVKTDKKKPWWKMRNFIWTYPPVEDPRDLELLANLTKTLQKKEMWLKDLQGKKRCWLKRVVNPMEESQKKDIFFTMIEIKLVSMVLKMSVISTSQLKWCEEKLNNMKFKDGKITRASTLSLFPSS